MIMNDKVFLKLKSLVQEAWPDRIFEKADMDDYWAEMYRTDERYYYSDKTNKYGNRVRIHFTLCYSLEDDTQPVGLAAAFIYGGVTRIKEAELMQQIKEIYPYPQLEHLSNGMQIKLGYIRGDEFMDTGEILFRKYYIPLMELLMHV